MKRIILLTILFFYCLNLTYAQPGRLDSSFGSMGTIEYNGGHITCIAIQSDDKVVVAGYTSRGNTEDIFVARYNSNGSFDKSFGNDGIVVTDFATADSPGTLDRATAIAIQGDVVGEIHRSVTTSGVKLDHRIGRNRASANV